MALILDGTDGITSSGGTNVLQDDAVITANIADGAVVAAKIADGAVSDAKIADGAVTASKLAAGVGGKVLQVVQTVKTDTFSVSLASVTTSGDVTGLTATITPINTNNKILVFCYVSGAVTNNSFGLILHRGGSVVTGATGDAAGSRARITSSSGSTNDNFMDTATFSFFDAPNSTSALTYSIRLRHSSGGTLPIFVNRSIADQDNGERMRGVSSITLMEIAA